MKRRFTKDDDDIICSAWNAYVPIEQIAIKIARDTGTTRQRIYKLRHSGRRIVPRYGVVSRVLKWCPENLKATLQEHGHEAFLEAVKNNTINEERRITEGYDADQAAIDAEILQIVARVDLERNEKMKALRAIGLTLEKIGERFCLTRERVRQLTDPDFCCPPYKPKLPKINNLAAEKALIENKLKEKEEQIRQATLRNLMALWNDSDSGIRKEFLDFLYPFMQA